MFKHQIAQIKHVGIVTVIYLTLIFGVGMFVGRQPQSKVLGILVMMMGASGGVLNNYRRLQQLPVVSGNLGNTQLLNEKKLSSADQEETATNQAVPSNVEQNPVVTTDEAEESEESHIIKKSHTIKSSVVSRSNEQEAEFMSRLFTMRIYISPLIGAFFAFIVHLVFVGGLVQGSLFPEYQCLSPKISNSEDNCYNYENFYSFGQNIRPSTNQDMAKLLLWGFIAGFAEGLIPSLIDNIAKDAFQQSREETEISEKTPAKEV